MIKISNHRIEEFWTPGCKDMGSAIASPRFIVMHYTAGGSGQASRDYMMLSPTQKQKRLDRSKKVYASAHLVIDRDGACWQIIPFNRKGRHAGVSIWKGLESINTYSIGIEIANYGWLNSMADGSYGRPDTPVFSASDVVVGAMPHSNETKGWEAYTEVQLQALEKVTAALLDHYPSITEILGHSDISPGRKFDPGPAFPINRFQSLQENRGDLEDTGEEQALQRYVAITTLNVRGGPGADYEQLSASPLAAGREVIERQRAGSWSLIQLGEASLGWVHNSYLRLL